MALGHGRLMVTELDSIRQIEYWCSDLDAMLGSQWGGYLRAVGLLCDRLLLTDSQLLDGAVTLSLGPDRLREFMGWDVWERPVVVSARASTLAESLRVLPLTADLEAYRPFRWSNLERFGVSSERLARELSGGSADRLLAAEECEVPLALAEDLIRLGRLPRAAGEQLRDEWCAWISEPSLYRIEQRSQVSAPVRTCLERRPGLVNRNDSVLAVQDQLRLVTDRSSALALIEGSGLPQKDRRALTKWWLGAYSEALALQHEAPWIALGPEHSGAFGVPVEVPSDIVQRLTAAPSPLVAHIRHAGNAARIGWLEERNAKAMRDLDYVVQHCTAPIARTEDMRWMATRLMLALAVFVLGLIVEVASGVSHE